MLLLLSDEQLLSTVQLSVLPAEFSTDLASSVLGQSSYPIVTTLMLRKLQSLDLLEVGCGPSMWRLQSTVRAVAADLSLDLQLPLISVRSASIKPQAPIARDLKNKSEWAL